MTALAFAALVLAAPSPAEIEEAAQRVFAGSDYQVQHPGELPMRAEPDPPQWDLSWLEFLGPIFEVVWWIFLTAVLVVVLVWLIQEFSRRAGARRKERQAGPTAPAGDEEALPLADPERFAREGRFGEAIHALLLRLLARFGARLSASWTSREVVARLDLPPERREALTGIVRTVEWTHFGGADAREEDYRACVAQAAVVLEEQP